MQVDTATVTSFNIERDNSLELANWSVFESGREVICVPPNWKAHLVNQDSGQELVLLPPNSLDSIERVTFSRLIKDNSSLDYPALAQELAKSAFPNFRVVEGDTLKKLVMQKAFAIERNVGLFAHGKTYKGYCLVYVNDSKLYQFRILFGKDRLKDYRGDLFRDIIGNLQIDKKYLVDNDNPLKQVINLR
ncbi:hypothetical protein GCM10011375_31650 [Hymenobacter qilianensis]|nr:hypothetical protein GCM10011375_31650 [Hymenobacter qilianensis]